MGHQPTHLVEARVDDGLERRVRVPDEHDKDDPHGLVHVPQKVEDSLIPFGPYIQCTCVGWVQGDGGGRPWGGGGGRAREGANKRQWRVLRGKKRVPLSVMQNVVLV